MTDVRFINLHIATGEPVPQSDPMLEHPTMGGEYSRLSTLAQAGKSTPDVKAYAGLAMKNIRSVADAGETFTPRQLEEVPSFVDSIHRHVGEFKAIINRVSQGCLKTRKNTDITRQVDHFKEGQPAENFEGQPITGGLRGNLVDCAADPCQNCSTCSTFTSELARHISGVLKDSPDTFHMHAKNLISLVHSWKQHLSSRGLNKNTDSSRAYNGCREEHRQAKDRMSVIERNLLQGYQDKLPEPDYEGGDVYGGVHSDKDQGI